MPRDTMQEGVERVRKVSTAGRHLTALSVKRAADAIERCSTIDDTSRATSLWLCLGFPRLPLEALGLAERREACVLTGGERDPNVLIGNSAAYALGIVPGLRISAAHALGNIQVHTRCEFIERNALESLATWCGQFTPLVSLAPPEGLLLEVGRSLTLFKGMRNLLNHIRLGMGVLGYQAVLAVAPTPLAALLFARARQTICITQLAQLRGSFGELPVELLVANERMAETLEGLGLRSVGDCLRLPRDGLARRFGLEFVSLFDRALGRQADPRSLFEPPARFERVLELPYEIDDAEALQRAARRLLLELSGFLRARGAGTQQLDWRLIHRDRRETRVRIALVSASRDPEHLGQLLRLQLDQWVLPEPVQAIKLIVNDLQPLAETTLPLLPGAKEQNRLQSLAFLERLRARLGQDAVSGLCLSADHRPEAAWRFCPPGEASVLLRAQCRPLWLLRQPQRLTTQAGMPYLKGILEPLGRGERIEGGWWEGQAIARDYFIACHPAGSRYWIFREVEEERRWFLHGIFD